VRVIGRPGVKRLITLRDAIFLAAMPFFKILAFGGPNTQFSFGR
jgi:hypothetical protein